MTDIIVKIPQKEAKTVLAEYIIAKEKKLDLNYKIPFFPKKCKRGDKCYFTVGNEVKGWHIIKDFIEDEFKCEITGKDWKGKFVVREGATLVKCKSIPIPFKLGRSFTYVETTFMTLIGGAKLPVLKRAK